MSRSIGVPMNDPLNPVEVEAWIRDLSDRISKSVKVCSDRYKDFLTADRDYDRAVAVAMVDYEGPQWKSKAQAEIDTHELRKAKDTADASYRYADRQAKALVEQLRASQSIGASIRQMYGVAGRGEGA